MKRLLLIALLALGAGYDTPRTVTLAWDYPIPVTTNETFYLYTSTNAALPTAQWAPLTNTPGTNLSVTVTMMPETRFFFVTVSNFWGQSDPSNVALTPAPPRDVTKLKVRLGQ